ncbi:MAG: ATP synthase F1 subunit gamma, partial [Chthoniobacterales bacterium]|nr:ATP synthase F1 subunit gamma [Chthoniobacterales bacterium]
MRKAQLHALAGRPYAGLMNRVLVSLQERTDASLHPLLQVREVKRELVIVISTDKGLAGPLNTNLLREVTNFDHDKTAFVVLGRKARQFLSRTRREILADFELKDAPAFVETKVVAQYVTERFLNGEVDKVSVLYSQFVNTINQKPVVHTLLPISNFDVTQADAPRAADAGKDPMTGYIFEPSAEGVLDVMLPYYLQYQLFQMILNARASEHSARMVAMKNATDNAKQFIKDLTLEYNKVRQASITTELLEISTAQMAVSG